MKIWVISDTHFGHKNLTQAETATIRTRPFTSVEEMDEFMIEAWNNCVAPTDKVYHLGDVAIPRRALKSALPRLHGRKHLIMGNHDIFKNADYQEHFYALSAMKVLPGAGVILTHAPVHEQSLRWGLNIHGHMHENHVLTKFSPNPRYINVCVENTAYAPVELEQFFERAKAWPR